MLFYSNARFFSKFLSLLSEAKMMSFEMNWARSHFSFFMQPVAKRLLLCDAGAFLGRPGQFYTLYVRLAFFEEGAS